MKILLDARLYGLENAGLGRYLINLIDGLIKVDEHNNYTILLKGNYYDRLRLPLNWHKVKVNFGHYGWEEQIKLLFLIKNLDPDLVHFPHFNVPLFCPKPYVVTIHDMLMHKQRGRDATTLPILEYKFKRIGYRIIFDHAVRFARKVIVPSNTVRQELISYYGLNPQKIRVTYEGVNELTTKGQTKIKLDKPYFIYTGNAYPHKNLERAFTAVAQLSEDVVFAIVSSRNVFVERLKQLVNKKSWQGRIKLLGFVSDENLSNLYRNSLGFLFPSLSEGFGLPGLEAMAAGTLCLCSDIPIFREIYKNNAIYFDPKDTNSIKDALEKVMRMTKEDRQKIIAIGKNFVRQYTWDKMAKLTLEAYESCLSL
jgi:glycosyltransferase involved in cell wall biosynthesis